MLSTGHFPQTKLDLYSLRLTCHAVKQNHLVHSSQLHRSKSCVSIKKSSSTPRRTLFFVVLLVSLLHTFLKHFHMFLKHFHMLLLLLNCGSYRFWSAVAQFLMGLFTANCTKIKQVVVTCSLLNYVFFNNRIWIVI